MSMSKGCVKIFLLFTAALSFALSGCGNGSSSTGLSPQTVAGFASEAAPISGTVTLQDSSDPAKTQMTMADASGNYSFDVTGLTPPFMLTVESPASATTATIQMYSFSMRNGMANINPFSDVTVEAAAGLSDGGKMSSAPTGSMIEMVGRNQERILEALKAQLAPLFKLYGITLDPVADDLKSERTALNALFRDVKITLHEGTILVTNKSTGAIIFEAQVGDIAGGTFYAKNLPGSTPSACTYTYSAWGACQSDNTQTRTMLTSAPAGCTGTPILSQSCTYTAPNTVTKADVTTSCTGCHGLTSNTTVFRSGGYTVTGRSAANWLMTVNNMVGMGARLATGKTARDYANYLATVP